VLRISELMTNGSQEQRLTMEHNTTNITKRSLTEQQALAVNSSVGSKVTSADIRQIKLNYLQLNKRASGTNQTLSSTGIIQPSGQPTAGTGLKSSGKQNTNEYTNNPDYLRQNGSN